MDLAQLVAVRPAGVTVQPFTITPNGEIRIVAPPTQKDTETWDSGTIDTVNRWVSSVGGGGTVTASVGQGQLSGGTTLNHFAKLTSIKAFKPPAPGQLYCDDRIGLEAGPMLTTGHRFWGQGTSSATPTIASPLINAHGWELTTAGVMVPVVYASGTRVAAIAGAARGLPTLTAAFNQITDGVSHNYFRYFEGRRGFWCVDDPDNVVAYFLFGNGGPDVNALPLLYQCISNGGTAVTMNINGIDVGDTADTSGALLLNNGFTYDEMVPNKDANASILTLTAQGAATVNSADQLNINGRGVVIGINTTVDAAGAFTVALQGKDIVSGTYYTIPGAITAAIAATGFTTLSIYPGIVAAANAAVSWPLPRTWRVQVVVSAGPITATVGASVIV